MNYFTFTSQTKTDEKNSLIQTLLSLLGSNLFSQVKISGTVKDNKNHPVAGVSITLKDTYDGATTDSSGAFSFRTTEKGEKNITASSIGAAAAQLAWFIPGLILRRRYRKAKEHHV